MWMVGRSVEAIRLSLRGRRSPTNRRAHNPRSGAGVHGSRAGSRKRVVGARSVVGGPPIEPGEKQFLSIDSSRPTAAARQCDVHAVVLDLCPCLGVRTSRVVASPPVLV